MLKSAFFSKLIAGIVAASLAFAGTPVIGIITASGHFTVERSEVWGNSTLFDGATVETKSASSELALHNGVKLQLGAASRARVWDTRVLLEKGVGQMTAPGSYKFEAHGLTIRAAGPSARMRVSLTDRIEVVSLTGTARVATGAGVLLAAIPAGRSMSFSLQAAESATVTRTGCLLYKDGHYILQDENTQEIAEVSGPDLAQNVGNRVEVTGPASSAKPAVTIATISVTAASVTQKSQGGCLSVASALDARTEVPPGVEASTGTPPPANSLPVAKPAGTGGGLSTGAKAAIILGLAGGGGAGIALALAGKKSSTSP